MTESAIPEPFSLAVDAMGGDDAPTMVVAGLALAAERHPGARFLLVGDEAKLTPLLASHPSARAACTIRHAGESVSGDMKPTVALRLRDSSMRVAIDAVANGEATGLVSAGNTGIDRPAMAATVPSARGDVVMLDLGANVVCDSRNLVEFAVMGEMFARTVLGIPEPTIGLLNVGSEELKGDDRLRRAADVLRISHIGPRFQGFVEGHDIAAGTTDVIVTDGFTGNVALKTGEGALKLMGGLLRQVFTSSLSAKIAYLLARTGLDRLREWLDPRRYNGAVMVGLNSVVVKSHGGTDALGFAHAVDVAMNMVTHGFTAGIADGLTKLAEQESLAALALADALPPEGEPSEAIIDEPPGEAAPKPDAAGATVRLAAAK
jgi:glycerol-3-phosphate acyltransferase PlsX